MGERWQTGFIFEVGSEAEYGSFEEFQSSVLANPVSVDWETMTARYTNTRGDELVLTYTVFDPQEPNIPNHTVPTFSVNGTPVAYDETWPVMESPWTRLQDQVLEVADAGPYTYTVDWSSEVPFISLRPPPVTGMRLEFLPPLTISYQSVDGVTYTLESTSSLSGGWTVLPGLSPNSGDGSEQSFPIDPLPDSTAFFRVRAE